MSIYFLGGGNMAAAIIAGLRRSGSNEDIFVADLGAERRRYLEDTYQVRSGESLPELNSDDVLLLAVKPQDMERACATVKHNGALILSIAAGLSIDTLSRYLGNSRRIIRIMPNTPAQVGLGVAGLFAPEHISSSDRQRAEAVMAASGITIWLQNEAQMHSITGISGSGPAYVFYLLNALQQAAADFGFSDEQARALSLATFKGAVELAEQSGEPFQTLQDKVTSKGGTTFAALESFRADKIAEHLRKGTQAAAARSQEMAQSAG